VGVCPLIRPLIDFAGQGFTGYICLIVAFLMVPQRGTLRQRGYKIIGILT